MRAEDWRTAERHVELDGEAEYVKNAAMLQRTHFSNDRSEGIIRLMEDEAYRRHRGEFDRYIDDFLGDLHDLFADIEA